MSRWVVALCLLPATLSLTEWPELTAPSSGFIVAKSENPTTFQIFEKINLMPACNRVQFVGNPKMRGAATFASGDIFTLDPFQSATGHVYYSNGNEYLSLVSHEDPNDSSADPTEVSWIVGVDPGVDSGVAFIRVPVSPNTLTPVGLESATQRWQWLVNSKWTVQNDTRLECIDSNPSAAEYYRVEYYDKSKQVQQTVLTLSINPLILARQAGLVNASDDTYVFSSDTAARNTPAYLDRRRMKWVALELESWQNVVQMGELVMITTQNLPDKRSTALAVLVNVEHAQQGWRLTFRTLSSKGANAVLKKAEPKKFSEADIDIILLPNGEIEGKATIKPVSEVEMAKYHSFMSSSLFDSVVVGEYLWVWYNGSIEANSRASAVDELLVQCVAKSAQSTTFRYFPTNRLTSMRQTILSQVTSSMTFTVATKSKPVSRITAIVDGNTVDLLSVFSLGTNLVEYLSNYLITSEGRANGMSSCYLYHAAVTIPKALVYAAEIVCLIIGSKPVVLIQYTTPSDHQWKAPLVKDLSLAIVSNAKSLGDEFPLDYRIYKYHNDETLVLFRRSRTYLADALVPHGQTQALHPSPYPDSDRLEEDWKLQIYYAWWNGFVLGYPEFFVSSYCENFHNGLSIEQRRQQISAAKVAVKSYLREQKQSGVLIKYGLDSPLSKDHLDRIQAVLAIQ